MFSFLGISSRKRKIREELTGDKCKLFIQVCDSNDIELDVILSKLHYKSKGKSTLLEETEYDYTYGNNKSRAYHCKFRLSELYEDDTLLCLVNVKGSNKPSGISVTIENERGVQFHEVMNLYSNSGMVKLFTIKRYIASSRPPRHRFEIVECKHK